MDRRKTDALTQEAILEIRTKRWQLWVMILLCIIGFTTACTLGYVMVGQRFDAAESEWQRERMHFLICVNLYVHNVQGGECERHESEIRKYLKAQ